MSRRTFPNFPVGPVGEGGRFAGGSAQARAELGRWYDGALALFEELSLRESSLSPIRVWPHHFDLGAILGLGGDASIGFGLSPGDEFFDEPYFYASPSPEPEGELPSLSGPGFWYREGFTSVILTATEVVEQRDQAGTARAWLDSALAACRAAMT